MADRVRRSRRQGFVGRTVARGVFAAALRGEPDAPRVLLVHGPGGIGKSALLRRLADDAEERGHNVVWLDGEQVDTSPAAFEQGAAAVHALERPVLLVDGFEHCQALEAWLREQFLLTVPENAVIVLASRQRPEPHWTLDPGWRDLARAVPVESLDPDEVVALLDDRDVPRALQPAVSAFAGGHPLALCLAAETATEPTSFDHPTWAPSPDVIETLLAQLVDRVPSAAHEYALRVCGHVRHTTVDLLRTGLDEAEAVDAFDWLCGLPYLEPGPHGLVPHELVRDVLDSDFAWRDPKAYAELHERLWRHLGERARTASGDAAAVAVSELLYLYRYSDRVQQETFDDPQAEPLFERAYTPELRADLLRLAREDQDGEYARLVAYWLDRQPEAFQVYCRAENMAPVSFLAWLRLRPDADDYAADPALVPVREYLDRSGEARPGEYVGVARFLVPEPAPGRYTTGSDRHSVQIATEGMRPGNGLVASFLVLPDPGSFVPAVEGFGFHLLASVPGPRDEDWGVFVHDWREVPVSAQLERAVPALGSAGPTLAPPTPAAGLLREDHDEAVRQALRDWHDDDAVAANPLVRIHGDGVAVRDALADAVEGLGSDPRRIKNQRAVRATYLDRATTQEATAARLGIPFSTYRRHLQAGVRLVCDYLWSHSHDGVSEPHRA